MAEAIREDGELTEEQKQTLLTVYETFRLQQQLARETDGRPRTTGSGQGHDAESTRAPGG